jgi:hypothetical protein
LALFTGFLARLSKEILKLSRKEQKITPPPFARQGQDKAPPQDKEKEKTGFVVYLKNWVFAH